MNPGDTLGPYQIQRQLGAGGMGEVWLATDTRLGRKVAVKVLPEQFAGDPERLARFEQEARAAAALNHPNIAAVFDVGAADGTHFMVQEYLQGQSLRDALAGGALSLVKALALGTEIAEALRAAHVAGIVHRDLKPENVFVTEAGHAKVLDFGLAKLTELASVGVGSASMSPTVLGTQAGAIMGTAGYMAPEQVQGEDVDRRADLFAFGCVLSEMLLGRRAFEGKSVPDTLARILHAEPVTATTLRRDFPAELGRIVDKCLAKERDDRFQHADDLLVDLRRLRADVDAGRATAPTAAAATRSGLPLAATATVALVALLVGAGLGAWLLGNGEPSSVDSRSWAFDISLPEGAIIPLCCGPNVRLVPNGGGVIFRVREADGINLYWRAPGESSAARLVQGRGMFFEPEPSGEGMLFSLAAENEWRRARFGGADSALFCEGCRPVSQVAFDEDGNVYLGGETVVRVPASGGRFEVVIEPDEPGHLFSRLAPFPGAGLILARERREGEEDRVVVLDVNSGAPAPVAVGTAPRWAPSGHVVFGRDGSLWAVPFDADRLVATGPEALVQAGVLIDNFGYGSFDIDAEGTLAYAPTQITRVRDSEIVVLDGAGRESATRLAPGPFIGSRLSPDGTRLAALSGAGSDSRPRIYDLETGTGQPVPGNPRAESIAWLPEGDGVAILTNDGNRDHLWLYSLAPGTPPVELPVSEVAASAPVVGPGSPWVYYSAGARRGVGRSRLDGTGEPETLVATGGMTPTDISADGELIAFHNGDGEAGVFDVETRASVLAGRGMRPHFVDGERAIVFIDGARLVRSTITRAPRLALSVPEEVLDLGSEAALAVEPLEDGARFLVVRVVPDPLSLVERTRGVMEVSAAGSEQARIIVRPNWTETLRRLAPAGKRP